MKKKWKVILCIALAVVVLGGSLTAWLLYIPPDTDPDAPFKDLSNWEKRRVMAAVEKYWETSPPAPSIYWCGDPAYSQPMLGLQYFGTFEGYHIILSPRQALLELQEKPSTYIGGYTFRFPAPFYLFAYKNGKVIPLEELYLNPLSKEQMQKIHQCFERYKKEIYIPMCNNDN